MKNDDFEFQRLKTLSNKPRKNYDDQSKKKEPDWKETRRRQDKRQLGE